MRDARLAYAQGRIETAAGPRLHGVATMDDSQGVSLGADTQMRDNVIAALRTVYDPEIPINIYDLGLIYAIDVLPEGRVDIRMTLTAPACPVAGEMPHVV